MSGQNQARWPKEYLNPPGLAADAARKPSPKKPTRRRSALWWEIIETALLTLVLFVLVRTVVLNFKVDGLSMAPNLQDGQYLLVNRIAYLSVDAATASWWPWQERCSATRCYVFQPPQRGDVVVFWPPGATDRPFIKRVIGLPGETVEVRDGQVIINGAALAEPYIPVRIGYTAAPALVPPDNYYVLGDNRNNSSDSRLFGMLPVDYIIGQAWLSYWPPETWGFLPAPTYAEAARGP